MTALVVKLVDESSLSVDGWLSFSMTILICFIFSYAFVKYFWSKTEKDKLAYLVVILGVSISFLTTFLLPVDVFVVSSFKNRDGSFKEWATNTTREAVEDSVTYVYYSLYGIVFFYTFFILPFVYFVHEERDEHEQAKSVYPRALLYTLIFALVIAALLVVGIVIPFKQPPPSSNSTEWDKFEFLIDELSKNRGKNALAFVVHILILYGMLNLIFYTAVGLASFPITAIKGFRSLDDESLFLFGHQASTQSKINSLRKKQSRRSLSSREAADLASLEEEESLLSRRSQLLDTEKNKFTQKLVPLFRVMNIIFGVLGMILSLLLIVSLLITNIDKLLHSLGYQMGYVLNKNTLFNPLDYIMVQSQKIFPLDYILFFTFVMYLFLCTTSGMRSLVVCFLGVPMYKLRPHHTRVQGLLMFTFVIIFTVLSFHVLMFAVLPSYITFGNQKYCATTNSTNTTCQLEGCTLDAPPDACLMTRSSAFMLTFAYEAWFFSFLYFWMTWVFMGAFVFSFIMNLVRPPKSFLEEAIDKDDFDETDEPMITP